jgi:hypothetical protein
MHTQSVRFTRVLLGFDDLLGVVVVVEESAPPPAIPFMETDPLAMIFSKHTHG